MPSTTARKYDLIVWGATGFTGQLVCEYLTLHYSSGAAAVKWAVGGRNREKLAQVVGGLENKSAPPPDILVADSSDLSALTAMVAQATVIITTVGPYLQHGGPLVAACVAAGTHYVDLTGEAPFVRAMMEHHHAAAQAKGVKIVHCCGFDSIPSDLGTLVAVDALRRRGLATASVEGYFGKSKGGASGGTLASVFGLFGLPLKQLAALGNPYYLNPRREGAAQGPCPPGCGDRVGLSYRREAGGWTMPFIMAAVNTRVVRRSAALAASLGAAQGYGPAFKYNESLACGPNGGWVAGLAMVVCIPLFALLALFPPTRALLQRLVRWCGLAPGQGPTREVQRTGFFEALFVATAEPKAAGAAADTAVVSVKGVQDPGYAETAKMLAEAALCLVDQQAQAALGAEAAAADLPYPGGGVLTPAVALGLPLVRRLRAKGMTFAVVERLREIHQNQA